MKASRHPWGVSNMDERHHLRLTRQIRLQKQDGVASESPSAAPQVLISPQSQAVYPYPKELELNEDVVNPTRCNQCCLFAFFNPSLVYARLESKRAIQQKIRALGVQVGRIINKRVNISG